MILTATAMLLSPEHDFGDAFGGDPTGPGLLPGLPDLHDMLPFLGGLFLIVVCWAIAQALGDAAARRRLREGRRGAAEAIYAEIDAALNRALRAPGGYQMDRVRELRDLVQARFAQVTALTTKPGKSLEGLEKALEADGGKLETNSITPAKIKVAMASEEHRLVVWEALQKFRAYWDRKAHIIALIEAAQAELSPEKSGVYLLGQLDRPERPARPVSPATAAAAVVAGALNDADKAGGAPVPAAEPAPEAAKTGDDEPPPPPPPAPPAPRRADKSKLPAHKRNMLA